jgi:hypothetical protein
VHSLNVTTQITAENLIIIDYYVVMPTPQRSLLYPDAFIAVSPIMYIAKRVISTLSMSASRIHKK